MGIARWLTREERTHPIGLREKRPLTKVRGSKDYNPVSRQTTTKGNVKMMV